MKTLSLLTGLIFSVSLSTFAADQVSLENQKTLCGVEVYREYAVRQDDQVTSIETELWKSVFSLSFSGDSEPSSGKFQKSELLLHNLVDSHNMIETTAGDEVTRATLYPNGPKTTPNQMRKLRQYVSILRETHNLALGAFNEVPHLQVHATFDRAFLQAAFATAGLTKKRFEHLVIPPVIHLFAINIDRQTPIPLYQDTVKLSFDDDRDSRMAVRLGCTVRD
jgi:hypothetical protein